MLRYAYYMLVYIVCSINQSRKETRHYKNLIETEAGYDSIIDEKTTKKGYKKVDMASGNIGSDKVLNTKTNCSKLLLLINSLITLINRQGPYIREQLKFQRIGFLRVLVYRPLFIRECRALLNTFILRPLAS